MLTILPVKGLPDITKGDNIGKLIVSRLKGEGESILQGDIVVVSQKIVSKAEGRMVSLKGVKPSPFALEIAKETEKDPRHVEMILRESKKIIRMKNGHLITETRHGFVCANAGIDMSNVGRSGDSVTLLPLDPDKSAGSVRSSIRHQTGQDVPTIITDTFGRAWRIGQVNFAIGVSGLKPIRDYRGSKDMYNSVLHVTEIAIADELASAAELVMNKADKVPVAIVRGYRFRKGNGTGRELIRPEEFDLFR